MEVIVLDFEGAAEDIGSLIEVYLGEDRKGRGPAAKDVGCHTVATHIEAVVLEAARDSEILCVT